MDIRNFFKKSSVENQASLSMLSKDTMRLIENSCLKVVITRKSSNVLLQGKTFKEIKLEPQRNANGMMIILCMGFIEQRKKC